MSNSKLRFLIDEIKSQFREAKREHERRKPRPIHICTSHQARDLQGSARSAACILLYSLLLLSHASLLPSPTITASIYRVNDPFVCPFVFEPSPLLLEYTPTSFLPSQTQTTKVDRRKQARTHQYIQRDAYLPLQSNARHFGDLLAAVEKIVIRANRHETSCYNEIGTSQVSQ